MELMYILICIIAFALLYPYFRCFFKRLKCAGKIKKLCLRKGYKTYSTHSLWFLGNKHANKCDLYVETANEVFSIKLFGMPRRQSVLVLKENGEYLIRSYIAFISYGGAITGKPKPMPVYDFRYRYRDEWEIKTPRNVLLVNPVSMEIRRQSRQGEVTIGAGDIVNGMYIDSLPRLLGDLESAI